jgi:uncharacterized repeat protein (TIGR03803 family)
MRVKEWLSCFRYLLTLLVALLSVSFAAASTETILHSFVSLPYGANPQANLIADASGNFYGTTFSGGRYGSTVELGYGTVFKLAPASGGKWKETVLYNFTGGSDGGYPAGGLILDGAGNLYGTTEEGGSFSHEPCTYSGCGVVFKLTPVGKGKWTETVLYSFQGTDDGYVPVAGLVFDDAGNLFGTTYYGGPGGWGTVFELTPGAKGGWTETTLYSFTDGADGANPSDSLTLDSSGAVYGTTQYGGDLNCPGGDRVYGCGTVFQLTKNSDNTWTEAVLYSFTDSDDGGYPLGNVIFDSAGTLYGTTPSGGAGSGGTVFSLTPNASSWNLSTIYNFKRSPDGRGPSAGLIFGKNGQLYGTTLGGGTTGCNAEGCGTVFELTQHKPGHWTERVIHRFQNGSLSDGTQPAASLLIDQEGHLYGTTAYGGIPYSYCGAGYGTPESCGTVFQLKAASGGRWIENVIYRFPPGPEGIGPAAGVISDGSGNLYSTTYDGGIGPCHGSSTPESGCGTVFELTPNASGGWRQLTLHKFSGIFDGAGPEGNLIPDASGNLYGTTSYGGSTQCIPYAGCGGTVFELSPTQHGWKETVLYTFPYGRLRGSSPQSGLSMDPNGNLYGTTYYGGGVSCQRGCGTVFELSRDGGGKWKEEVLHSFRGGSDGANPQGTLVFDDRGSIYGTTCAGGSDNLGTVFQLTPGLGGNWNEHLLHTFQGGSGDGYCAVGGVIFDANGNLYGATLGGGDGSGGGIVFELTPTGGAVWKETILWNFQGMAGPTLNSGLTMDELGNLYGTAFATNYNYGGYIFELSPGSSGWTEHTLYSFGGWPDGSYPMGPIIFDAAGNLYGTTGGGGTDVDGTVFRLSLGGSMKRGWRNP